MADVCSCSRAREIWISLGANIPGPWGAPAETILRAVDEITKLGLAILSRSAIYQTVPVGNPGQPPFANMILGACGSIAPTVLLRSLKRIERRAGRRSTVRGGPRSLDLDIIDYGGRRVAGAASRRRTGQIILPHPEAHRRGFVLVPLAEASPQWRHPVLGTSARQLLMRHQGLARGVRRGPEPPYR